MKSIHVKKILFSLVLIICSIFFLIVGFFIGKAQQERRFAEMTIGQLTLGVGALMQLERNNPQFAKERLVQTVEGQIVILSEFESASIDDASQEIRGLALQKFSEIRAPQPSKNEDLQAVDHVVERYIEKYRSNFRNESENILTK